MRPFGPPPAPGCPAHRDHDTRRLAGRAGRDRPSQALPLPDPPAAAAATIRGPNAQIPWPLAFRRQFDFLPLGDILRGGIVYSTVYSAHLFLTVGSCPMPLLVVGSIALDSVETPSQRRDDVLGGSAVFFSYAASYFAASAWWASSARIFRPNTAACWQAAASTPPGLHVVPGAKTFRWRGKYLPNMNDRETLEVHLNVFEHFDPVLPEAYRRCRYLFLANGSPGVQLKVLDQVAEAALVVADTMDLWIHIQRDELLALLKRIDGLVLNDSEAKLLTGDENLVRAGRAGAGDGPKFVVIKKGEHGAMFFSERRNLCPARLSHAARSSIRPGPATVLPAE